jgi:predicted PhzF superfamily epimerase YddE/YHI9
VTGSSHCSLTPFWAKRLKKEILMANQISKRGGSLKCFNNGNRVIIGGKAKTYFIGKIQLD